MIVLKPKLKNGRWWVRWLFGCIEEVPFKTKAEAEEFREGLLKEYAELEYGN